MNSSRPDKKQKSNAQAMVEFALALPILLTLLYGMLESGRLLFIFASTVTAARQAVRYGSATGDSPNGMPYYMDCDGIEAAARQVGFINSFESVTISYDGGLDSNNGNPLPLNPADPACGSYTDANVQNGDRIIVEVTAQWVPIVSIVPLEPFTITSQSERTILVSIPISVTAVPQGWQPSDYGILTLSMSVSPTTYSTVGETINYTYSLSNAGTSGLSEPFTVNDSIAATNCSGAPAALEPGGSFNCTGVYQITQADLDAGSVTNTATAFANGTPSIPATKTITAIQSPALTLSKSASPTVAFAAGTHITYTYTLSNTGNVTLTSPYTVADNKIAVVNCSGAASPLAPAATTTCTASYSITDTDINNGSVVNQAVAGAKFKTTTVTSNSASATVNTSPLTLIISVSPPAATLANQVITYTYAISNNSGTTVNSLSVTDDKITVSCDNTTIAAGGSTNCTGTYTVTQAALDTGGPITNSATASGNIGSPVSSNTATASLVITQTPALAATVSGTPSQPPSPPTMPAPTDVTYTYTLTNTGNVTLTSPFSVSDNKTTITCADPASMPPAATKTCTGTYTVTDPPDVAAGSIINTGTAAAKFGAQTITSNPASFTVITFSDPRFSIAVSGSPNPITQAGDITYTYTITNTGGTNLTSPYSITTSGTDSSAVSCALASATLAPGTSTTCTSTKAVSTTGSYIVNITAATASGGAVNATPPLPSATVSAYICSATSLTMSALSRSGKNVSTIITNNVGMILHITSISIAWDDTDNKNLTSIQFPTGTNIWTGNDRDGSFNDINPAHYIIPAPWTLNTGGSTSLNLGFNKNLVTVTNLTLNFQESGCGPLSSP